MNASPSPRRRSAYPATAAGNRSEPAALAPLQAEWLAAIMQGSFSEVYIADCASLRLICLNQAARANLQYDEYALAGMTLADIAGDLSKSACRRLLQPLHKNGARQATLDTMLTRQDGSRYPAEMRLLLSA